MTEKFFYVILLYFWLIGYAIIYDLMYDGDRKFYLFRTILILLWPILGYYWMLKGLFKNE